MYWFRSNMFHSDLITKWLFTNRARAPGGGQFRSSWPVGETGRLSLERIQPEKQTAKILPPVSLLYYLRTFWYVLLFRYSLPRQFILVKLHSPVYQLFFNYSFLLTLLCADGGTNVWRWSTLNWPKGTTSTASWNAPCCLGSGKLLQNSSRWLWFSITVWRQNFLGSFHLINFPPHFVWTLQKHAVTSFSFTVNN